MGIADDILQLRAEHMPLGPELTEAAVPPCGACGDPWPCTVIRLVDHVTTAADQVMGVARELDATHKSKAMYPQARQRLATRLHRAIYPPPPRQ